MIFARNILRLLAILAFVTTGACVRDNITGSIASAGSTAAIPRAAPVENTPADPARPGQTQVALLPVSAPNEQTQALTDAMTQMLALNGFYMVTAPDSLDGNEDLYFVAPQFNVKPDDDGQHTLEVAWIIANSSGDTLGKVAQRRQIESASNSAGWQRSAALGAAAAAEGVSRIIREQRDL